MGWVRTRGPAEAVGDPTGDPVPSSGASDPVRRARPRCSDRSSRRLAVAAVVVALVPLAVGVVTTSGDRLLGDFAILDLRVRDVLSGHLPLVGAYSRYGWNHPGPIFTYLTAAINGVLGGGAHATVVAAVVVQAVAVVLIGRVAWRQGGLPMVLGALLALLLPYGALGAVALVAPWNPFVTVPYLVLFVLEVWAVVTGRPMELIAVAAVGTFLVQTHIGYTPFVAVGVLLIVASFVVDRARGRRVAIGRPLAWSGALLAVVWIPPVVDQLTESGNLGRVVRYFTEPHRDTTLSLGGAARLVASGLSSVPRWVEGRAPSASDSLGIPVATSTSWWVAVLVVVLFACGALAVRTTRSRRDGALLVLVGALTLTAVYATTRLESPIYDYLASWRYWLAALALLAVGQAVARVLPLRRGTPAASLAVGALALSLAASATVVAVRVSEVHALVPQQESAVELAAQLAPTAPRGPVLLERANPSYLGAYEGLVDELDRRGVDVRVPRRLAFKYGDRRVARERDAAQIWYLATSTWDLDRMLADHHATIAARTTPLTPSHERELVDLQARVVAELRDRNQADWIFYIDSPAIAAVVPGASGSFAADLSRLAALNRAVAFGDRCRCVLLRAAGGHRAAK